MQTAPASWPQVQAAPALTGKPAPNDTEAHFRALSRALRLGSSRPASGCSMTDDAADCSVFSIRRSGDRVTEEMIVRAGRTFRTIMTNVVGPVLEARITKKPTRGSAAVTTTALVYEPEGGFVGKDRFRYLRLENGPGGIVRSSVVVIVEVIPD